MIKKILYYAVNALSVIIIAAALAVLLSVVLTRQGETPNIMGYSVFRVVTGSMKPEINENDLIVVKETDASEIKTGDVISFRSADPSLGGAVNTHRVVQITQESGSYLFTTKGDANLIEDPYPVGQDDLIGVVVFTSAFLGALSRLVSNPLVFIPLILVPLLLILLTNMVKTIKLARTAAEEEEARAITEAIEEAKRRKAEQAAQTAVAPAAQDDIK